MASILHKMHSSFFVALVIAAVSTSTTATAKSIYGDYPACDKVLNDWAMENVGTRIDSIEYKFEADPGPGNFSKANVYLKGCDGYIKFEISVSPLWCKKKPGALNNSIIKKISPYDKCL